MPIPMPLPAARPVERTGYTCACCGHRTMADFPGSHAICQVCFWQDDPVQILDPAREGGANRPSLIECQASYALCGAAERRFVSDVRPPDPDEPRDPFWRPATVLDAQGARAPGDLGDDEAATLRTWHYWLNG